MCPPYRSGPSAEALLIDVAERHRGEDALQTYLAKLRRTMTDMLAGRPVRRWRLARLQEFCEDVSRSTLMHTGRGCF